METTPHERAAAATPNLHPKSCPETEDSAQLTLAPVKPVLSQSSLKSVPSEAEHQESHTDSFKLKVLLKFLTDKGWEVSSIKGSHLKLKLRGEALIIPVNNPELKRGTLHGILKQEKEKEKRLIEKK